MYESIALCKQEAIATHSDYHLFEHKGMFYLYDIIQMNILEISRNSYERINRLDKEQIKKMLEDLEIKSGSKQKNVPNFEPQAITNISINVSQICNLSCVYCYGVDGEYGGKGLMPDEIAFKSVDFLIRESRNQRNISITFFGGEPLLNFPLIQKVVDYSLQKAKEFGKRILFSITTNGTLLTDEINAYLNEKNITVMVSLDGDEEIQNRNRPFTSGKGSYQHIKERVQAFMKTRKGGITARATITNPDETQKVKEHLLGLGFRRAFTAIVAVSDFAKANRNIDTIDISQLKVVKSNSDMEANEILNAIKKRSLINDQRESIIMEYIQQLKRKTKRFHPCGAGRAMAGISIYGDIYPCHRFVGDERFVMGSINEHDKYQRTPYSVSYTEKGELCNKCWARYQCGGRGCIQDNLVTNGDINEVNIRQCMKMTNELKNAIYIYSNLDKDDRKYLFYGENDCKYQCPNS